MATTAPSSCAGAAAKSVSSFLPLRTSASAASACFLASSLAPSSMMRSLAISR
jgi:hypothetical protein